MERLENIKVQIGIVILAQFVALFALFMADIEGVKILPMLILVIINSLVVIWVVYWFESDREQRDIDISRILGHDAKDALLIGEMGIITYDEQYCATWMSELLQERGVNIVGKKLTSWIGDITELFQGEVDSITAHDGEYVYEITRKENGQVLFVKDITEFARISEKFQEDGIVAGLLQLDNYMEIQQYEDETKMAQINTCLRQPLVEWADKYGMLIRRLRSDRFLVVLNEKIYQQVVEDKFAILNTVRKNAEDIDVSITLSMAFARGTDDFAQLDTMISDLLELAQSRGGDQAAVKKYGESVKYYGGNSEAREKRSKVRVRVVSQAIREAIMEAKRVFVIGHRDMDFDCMGAALCMSRLATAYNKESYIVSQSSGIEPQLAQALTEYEDIFSGRHRFLQDEEAARMIEDEDLLIVVDHNNPKQTGAPLTLEAANRIIVIDHHRRSEDFIGNPLLVYVETSASSTCELAAEFLPYQTNRVNLSEEEATLMYVGILVDTNRFRNRTGSRTFESVAYLKKLGIDPIAAENMLKEDFRDFAAKTEIMNYSQTYADNIIIAAVEKDAQVNRTLMSQAADSMLEIKGVEASFVIARINENECGISARSKGVVNVQVIMEKMHGGGHFNAAALQRKDTSVKALKEELKKKIDEYIEENKEETKDESNTAK
ncbi:DHH family phosphoesterase [Erysipelotrichaceae bacterium AM07-12]|uniref:DHH family phosphoesterase n=1 Tax=Longicatena caecimuris TaxID=1796635 RepID=UPI000E419E34|nr:DHH family phosphoesterase [Longicatena caecimuris]RGD43143.1 DHH family phosphoesterase [Erysipelotrichaceae bacterium AM07-12]RGD45750.1 DHH family phosphoesterase [Erysipelotrichaceae bacterium AM07-35-1]